MKLTERTCHGITNEGAVLHVYICMVLTVSNSGHATRAHNQQRRTLTILWKYCEWPSMPAIDDCWLFELELKYLLPNIAALGVLELAKVLELKCALWPSKEHCTRTCCACCRPTRPTGEDGGIGNAMRTRFCRMLGKRFGLVP